MHFFGGCSGHWPRANPKLKPERKFRDRRTTGQQHHQRKGRLFALSLEQTPSPSSLPTLLWYKDSASQLARFVLVPFTFSSASALGYTWSVRSVVLLHSHLATSATGNSTSYTLSKKLSSHHTATASANMSVPGSSTLRKKRKIAVLGSRSVGKCLSSSTSSIRLLDHCCSSSCSSSCSSTSVVFALQANPR